MESISGEDSNLGDGMNNQTRDRKCQTNIHTIELKMILNAISKDSESSKAEIEERRNDFETEIGDVFPIPPQNV